MRRSKRRTVSKRRTESVHDVAEDEPTVPEAVSVQARASADGPRSSKRPSLKRPLWEALSQDDFAPNVAGDGDIVLTCGTGDVGQLGHGEDRTESKKPRRIENAWPQGTRFMQIVAGGMHSAVLTSSHKVYTWGCNDDGALGREIEDPDAGVSYLPGLVTMPKEVTAFGKIVMISAGDAHTAVLTSKGAVAAWGTFRVIINYNDLNKETVMGLKTGLEKAQTPVIIWPVDDAMGVEPMVKISSGCNHIAMLSQSGKVYTVGSGDAGQLGRVAATIRTRASSNDHRLIPDEVPLADQIVDVFSLAYGVLVKTFANGKIWGWGLNNYSQLGLKTRGNEVYKPKRAHKFDAKLNWKAFVGEHHVLALTEDGLIYGIGRADDGRLAQGDQPEKYREESPILINIPTAPNRSTVVASGLATSFGLTGEGSVYAWGFNTNYELGLGEADDDEDKRITTPKLVESKHLEDYKVIQVAVGGQHTIFLAKHT